MKEKYAVEYSVLQGAFHVDTLGGIIQLNQLQCISGQGSDYRIVGVFDTHEEAISFSEDLENKAIFKNPIPNLNAAMEATKALYRGMAMSSLESKTIQ